VILAYRARVLTGTLAGHVVANRARISLEDHTIGFGRSAEVGIERPDLSSSTFGCEPAVVRPGGAVTCGLTLANAGTADAESASARVRLPGMLTAVSDPLWGSSGAAEWRVTENDIHWTGPLPVGSETTLTFQLRLPPEPVSRILYGVAFLDDGVGGKWERPAWLQVRPWQAYLPVLMKQD
jgi:hypothetical protein